ncbi:hypothetical protein CI109_104867 [Kwoniella shandongensis]|uniref:Uncharacterized protein n=1 Tax=Kwoniella shandongensis TaxID=1734106 RepID=A0AAJ8LNG3_9TREE
MPRQSSKPPSYLASTAASRAKNPRPTASQLFDAPPGPSQAKKATSAVLDPTKASIPCPVCPDFTGVNVLDHCRNKSNHPGIPFVQSDFGRCQSLVQTCEDCGTVVKPGKAALSSHLTACKGRTEEMVWRMLGGTEYVIKDKESVRTYRLPTIPNLSSTGSMRMKVFAAAPPSAAAPPARAHPTPPSLMLSRDEPRSDPMGPLSPSSPSPSPPPAREPTPPPQARPPTRHTATQPEQGPTSFGTPTPRPRLQTRATPQSTPRQVSRLDVEGEADGGSGSYQQGSEATHGRLEGGDARR